MTQPLQPLQPLLHDLVGVVRAPTSALSDPAGQIRPGAGVQGVFHADARVLSGAVLLVDGREPEPIAHAPDGPHGARFVALARWLGDPGADPTVRIDRLRVLEPDGLTERIEFRSSAAAPVRATLTLDLSCDLAPIDVVKSGGAAPPLPEDHLVWRSAGTTVTVTGEAAATAPARLSWPIELPPGGAASVRWRLRVHDPRAVVAAPPGPPPWSRPEVAAGDRRLTRLLQRSLDDLDALRLIEPGDPAGTFIGAGVPWFLTLFGRDSLWAARMLLPLGTSLAAGTLRVLARRQATADDPATGAAPGKIMHELRRDGFGDLPAAYYGTVDATLLWIVLLHEAWRWGLPPSQIEPLLPALEAALRWLSDSADPDGDGFVEYVDAGGAGLSNQGWKDSGDAVRFHDGRRATAPIALVEVQGYAHQAALSGAALLDAFGRPDGDRWRAHAARLSERFRAAFWVDGPLGPHPALALDAAKRPVDSLTSNIGHLLGTGLLTAEESARVAAVLSAPQMSGGFGLRTMSTTDAGFSPLSYHCGSIWPHDTAIVLSSLAATGHPAAAATLAEGLLSAAEAFGYRLPELYGGDERTLLGRPVPYPAACSPQAWSAAASVSLLQSALGLYPDVPAGRVALRPPPTPPFGPITARGLSIAGAAIDVSLDATGAATIDGLPAGIAVVPA
jgi:hypothetical protein